MLKPATHSVGNSGEQVSDVKLVYLVSQLVYLIFQFALKTRLTKIIIYKLGDVGYFKQSDWFAIPCPGR